MTCTSYWLDKGWVRPYAGGSSQKSVYCLAWICFTSFFWKCWRSCSHCHNFRCCFLWACRVANKNLSVSGHMAVHTQYCMDICEFCTATGCIMYEPRWFEAQREALIFTHICIRASRPSMHISVVIPATCICCIQRKSLFYTPCKHANVPVGCGKTTKMWWWLNM